MEQDEAVLQLRYLLIKRLGRLLENCTPRVRLYEGALIWGSRGRSLFEGSAYKKIRKWRKYLYQKTIILAWNIYFYDNFSPLSRKFGSLQIVLKLDYTTPTLLTKYQEFWIRNRLQTIAYFKPKRLNFRQHYLKNNVTLDKTV